MKWKDSLGSLSLSSEISEGISLFLYLHVGPRVPTIIFSIFRAHGTIIKDFVCSR